MVLFHGSFGKVVVLIHHAVHCFNCSFIDYEDQSFCIIETSLLERLHEFLLEIAHAEQSSLNLSKVDITLVLNYQGKFDLVLKTMKDEIHEMNDKFKALESELHNIKVIGSVNPPNIEV